MGGSLGSSMLPILLIIVMVIVFVYINKKRKKESGAGSSMTNSRKKNEVWQTIKSYLKDSGELGKEISSSFVAKRPSVFLKSKTKKQFFDDIKKNIKEKNMDKIEAAKYKNAQIKQQNRELYCILFVTKDVKNNVEDKPRIIEAEVLNVFVNKRERKRVIKVNGLMEYDKEIVWIKPLKDEEDKKIEKIRLRNEKIRNRKLNKRQKKLEKQIKKAYSSSKNNEKFIEPKIEKTITENTENKLRNDVE